MKGRYLILVLILLASLIFLSVSGIAKQNSVDIDSKVMKASESQEYVSVFIELKDEQYETFSSKSINSEKNEKEKKRIIIENKKNMVKSVQDDFKKTLEKKEGFATSDNNADYKGIKIKKEYSFFNTIYAEVNAEALEDLKNNPLIKSIKIEEQFSTTLNDSIQIINASLVHNLSLADGTKINGSGEVICLIDSGINYSISAFGSCSEADFLAGNCNSVIGGHDYISNDTNPMDVAGHGTKVASAIISINETFKGIAPGAKIYAMRACGTSFGDPSCSENAIISSLDDCISNSTDFNISIVSMSLGSTTLFSSSCDASSTLASKAGEAANSGLLVLAATGNDASSTGIASPACAANVTSVGATTKADAIASFSNSANILDLLTPGVDINLAQIGGTFAESNGTSFSTPIAAGSFALILQAGKALQNITLNRTAILDALNSTGKQINDTRNGVARPRINIRAAFNQLFTPNITIINPDNDTINADSFQIINITSNEQLTSALIEIDSANITMNGSGNRWFTNLSGSGKKSYKVYGIALGEIVGVSESRILTINDSAPNITSTSPANINVSIIEPNNQSFSITFSDAENNTINITWRLDGNIVTADSSNQSFSNYSFIGNFTSQGNHTVNATITDGALESSFQWSLQVNNTNSIPVINSFFPNTNSINIAEPNNQTFNVSASDNEGDSLNYTWLVNGSNSGSAYEFNFTGNFTQAGFYNITVIVSDGLLNASNQWNFTINNTNRNPVLGAQLNLTVNSSSILNFNGSGQMNATDVDTDDTLSFSINGSLAVNQTTFNYTTTNNDVGVFEFNISVSDSKGGSDSQIIIVTIINSDTDGDGNPDINETDDDGDGINDTSDFLLGNESSLVLTNISNLGININSSSNLSQIFNSTLDVEIKESNSTIISFSFNFNSSNVLSLPDIFIKKETGNKGGLIVGTLQNSFLSGLSKSFFINDSGNYNGVCIKNSATVRFFTDISTDCSSTNETFVLCPGSSGGFTCAANGTLWKISGLTHSGVVEQNGSSGQSTTTSSGGGGGGGSSTVAKTVVESQALPEDVKTGEDNLVDFEKAGDILSIKAKEKAKFKFSIAGSNKFEKEDHSLTIDEVISSGATFTINSEPQTFSLQVSEEKEIDLDKDNISDISLALKSVNLNLKYAEFNIKLLTEGKTEEIEINKTMEEINESEEESEELIVEEGKNIFSDIIKIIAGAVALAIIVSLVYIISKRKINHNQDNNIK